MSIETLKNAHYRVLHLIGRGSLGEVYLVEDSLTKRHEVLKIIRANESLLTQEAVHSFEEEAKTIGELHHPHILPLLDYGEEVIDGSLLPYVIMPYCPDGSLATWLQQRGNTEALSLQDVAVILRQAADALHYAHSYGIIHQGVKPSNLLIREGSKYNFQDLALADFRIALSPSGTPNNVQALRDTLIYVAPEQWKEHPLPATDQYALAVVLYELLAGCPPFQGNAEQLMHKHIDILPAPPSTFNPALSQGIDTVLLRALSKEPGERFPSISAFASAFERVIQLIATPAMIIPAPHYQVTIT